jgi:phenylalanyl-tRNA synthetase beta chain
MPVVGISINKLTELIGKPIEKEELIKYLEELGCDIEGFAKIKHYKCENCNNIIEVLPKEAVPNECELCGHRIITQDIIDEVEILRLELQPSRPDMFDVAGLSRAIKGYLGYEVGIPKYKVLDSGYSVKVDEKLSNIRPYIACAVIRNLSFDNELIKIIMKLQENLHWALGRNRKKASIGIYDLDKLNPDFQYKAIAKDGIRFVPLGGTLALTPGEILTNHPKGKAYRYLLEDFKEYPILIDSNNQVLSMPPIINSDNTKLTLNTKQIFIDVTGIDLNIVNKTLNVLVFSLAELGGKIESVKIIYPNNKIKITPVISPYQMQIDLSHAKRLIGIEISSEELVEILNRMRFEVIKREDNLFIINIPAYRVDIMHEVDILEDIAIGYGYHNIKPCLVQTFTIAKENKLEQFSSLIRNILTNLGFFEIKTLMLTNPKQHYEKLNLPEDSNCVRLENPVSIEQTMIRTHLLSGLLETFRLNLTHSMPQKIFEIGDICIVCEKEETGVSDIKKCAGGIISPKTGFSEIKSIVEALMNELALKVEFSPIEHPSFIDGRVARISLHTRISLHKREIGIAGEVHPQVLENFQITQPVTIFEVDLTKIILI